MKKDDIKENVDNMVFQICKYIKASDLSDKEDTELKLECAMSFLVASIDFTDNPVQNIEYIMDQHVKAINDITHETSKSVIGYILGEIQEDRLL